METKTQNKGLKVIEVQTQLIVPHKDGELTFIYQSKQKGNYINVRNNIENQNLSMPTIAETISLVHLAFQEPDNKYAQEIIKLMENNWLWGNNGILWTPKGAYVQDNPPVVNGKVTMNKSELIDKLEKEDKTIRFVPYGFELGEQSSLELSKNNFVIALVGGEAAYKLVEIADKHKRKPYLYGLEKVDKPVQRVASLYSDWYVGGLGVDGDDHVLDYHGRDGRGLDGHDLLGCAFGVLKKSGEATRAEK